MSKRCKPKLIHIFHFNTKIYNAIGKKNIISGTVASYVNSDDIRGSRENSDKRKRIPKGLNVHGGINDDPEAAAHHFPALSIGGEGDPAFLDTLLSIFE